MAGYHSLTHHGQLDDMKKQLLVVERFQMTQLAKLLDALQATPDERGAPLLDSTMVLFGSPLGNGNIHTNTDLPIILAGGGLKHRGHRRMPTEPGKRVPLSNLYLAMLRHFGLPITKFGASTGVLEDFA